MCLLSIIFIFLLIPTYVHSHPIFSHTLIIDTGNSRPENGNQNLPQQRSADQPAMPVLNELKEHFAGLDAPKVERLNRQLQRAKQLAHQIGYGHRRFSHDSELDRQKPVSISSAQPNTSAELAQLLFEGDILLTDRQLGVFLARLEEEDAKSMPPRVPTKRSLSADPEAIWSRMPIKFRLHESLEFSAIQQIIEAIAYWENNTCIRFEHREQPQQQEQGEDFVEFFKGQGCYSMIGRYGGRQGVSIGAGCERVGIVEHEIGHVLGLWHEQSRPDAWKYIHVEKAFIMPSYMADFQLRGSDEILTLGLPYDYGSVMHYGPTAFSSDGTSVTLMTKNILFQSTIGQRDRLAFFDVMSVNKAYCADVFIFPNQPDKCGGIPELRQPGYKPPRELAEPKFESQAKCRNGGYPNPGRCQQCICPNGYGGNRCEQAQEAKIANCGGELFVENGSQLEIKSPDYDGDGYQPGQQCNWIVRSPSGTRIQVEFIGDFSLLCATICVDYVELKLAKDQRLTGARFCCADQKPTSPLVSEYNQIAIIFRAQLAQDIGFQMRLRATNLAATNQKTGKNLPDEGGGADLNGGLGKKARILPGKNIWGEWAAWSACSRPCGGCGIRSRIRECLSADCPNGKPQEFSACNFQACPIRPNCQKVLFLNRLCHHSVIAFSTPPSNISDSSPSICSELANQLGQCNQPSCCPPFYALNGKCVTDEFDQHSSIIG